MCTPRIVPIQNTYHLRVDSNRAQFISKKHSLTDIQLYLIVWWGYCGMKS